MPARRQRWIPLARTALLTAALLPPSACREGAAPFTPPVEQPDSADPRQLTFNQGDERDPQWSPAGDSIYYHATNWYDGPGPGTLLRIGAAGGPASPLADHAQPSAATFLATPAVPAGGGRLAYLHFARIRAETSCQPSNGQDPPGNVCLRGISPEPVLDSAVLRVRSSTALNPAVADPGLAVRFVGLDPQQWSGGPPPYYQRVYPFHVDWRNGESSALRPSWSPAGNRLVFSNGMGLFTWAPGEAAAAPVPNTLDGVSPAWSPDGNWIAFTVIERGDSAVADCLCGPMPFIHHLRTYWQVLGRRLVVIRPDGTGRRELGDGQEPAWAPDSKTLYVRRAGAAGEAIYRVPVDQPASASPVPLTGGGRMPAVSPDGKRLAFVLREPGSNDLDIWIKDLTR